MVDQCLRLARQWLSLCAFIALAACGGGSESEPDFTTSAVQTVPASPAPPSPSPAPTPTVTPTAVPTSALAGLDPIASNVDVSRFLSPAWGNGAIPGPEQGEGAFRFICEPSHNAYDDPIVFPGQPGRAHLHTFFGNTKADAYSTYASLRTMGDSTCNNLLNRSAYWIPAMMNGAGKVVMPDYIAIYYKGLPSSSPLCSKIGKACITLPRGLRYIFGHNMQDSAGHSPSDSMWWNCDAPNAGGHFANIAQAAKNCPVGARFGMVMTGPSCWDGAHLDSADHRSHMAYTRQNGSGIGVCPPTHPYVVPHFTIGAWYTTDATLDRSGDESPNAKTWYLSSDRMAGMPNAVPGTTMHSDWFGAWDDDVMAIWMANCIEKMLSCSGGDLGNGRQLTQISGYRFPNATSLVDPPSRL